MATSASVSHTVEINELEIRFPFQPYDVQKDLMAKVLECIETRENGLLESPTGTGKTLSLLCATLAWQKRQKLLRQSDLAKYNMSKMGSQNKFQFGKGRPVGAGLNPSAQAQPQPLDVPTIIYASRTHSQLSQAVRELKRSHYKTAKSIVLGSRDLLCIHEEVSRLESSSAKIMVCHAKIHSHTCAYYNNVAKTKDDPNLREPSVIDIEDIVKKGKKGRFCPFYMSRELVKEAEIVFMPYNYLLDPKLRSSHGIDITNAVIILDEGHNIAKICEDAVSFEMKSSLIASCIQEVTQVLSEYAEASAENNSLLAELSLTSLVQLKKSFLLLEDLIDRGNTAIINSVVPAARLIEPMKDAGFTQTSLPRIIKDLDATSTFLTGHNHDSSGCDKFGSILRVLNSQSMHPDKLSASYRVYVHAEEFKQDKYSVKDKDKIPAKTFQFWCLNPALGLETLLQHRPRCIILSSGTLSPIPFLVQELLTPFPIQLSNPHIITDKQLFASVIGAGPRNVRLTSTFQNRNDPTYLAELGDVIVKVCSVVPKGVLVFFPSYVMLEICHTAWEKNGVAIELNKYKKVLIEPRRKDAFVQIMDTYYSSVKIGNGACLMAVCRGKVSEGLDFTDDNGRAVIITGIPYSPAKDPRVLAKQQYLDQQISSKSTNSRINGNLWYQLEACRALNQAIGRIIRHAHDYGAILLCDERCGHKQFQDSLSHWVHSRLQPVGTFEQTLANLAKFFGTTFQQERKLAARASASPLQPIKSSSYRPPPAAAAANKDQVYESITEHDLDLVDDDVGLEVSMEFEDGVVQPAAGNSKRKSKISRPAAVSLFGQDSRSRGMSEEERNARTELVQGALLDKEVDGLEYGADIEQGTRSRPGFNSELPLFTKSFAAFSRTNRMGMSPLEETKRRKIKISSVNTAFSSMSSNSGSSQDLRNSSYSTEVAATSSSNSQPAPAGADSIKQFWKWVKKTLDEKDTELFSLFRSDIKEFHKNRNLGILGSRIKMYFVSSKEIEVCLKGFDQILSEADMTKLRQQLGPYR